MKKLILLILFAASAFAQTVTNPGAGSVPNATTTTPGKVRVGEIDYVADSGAAAAKPCNASRVNTKRRRGYGNRGIDTCTMMPDGSTYAWVDDDPVFYASKFGVIVNDGVDDSAALQAAITAAAGMPVLLPEGTIRLDSQVVYTVSATGPGLQLLGRGKDKTIIQTYVASNAALKLNANTTSIYQKGVKLRDFSISLGGATASASGIELQQTWFVDIHNVKVTGLTGSGLIINGVNGDPEASSTVNIKQSEFSTNSGWGLKVDVTAPGNNLLSYLNVEDSRFLSNVTGGIQYSGLTATFSRCSISYNRGSGGFYAPYVANLVQNLQISHCEFDTNYPQEVKIEGAIGVLINDCQFTGNDGVNPSGNPTNGIVLGVEGGTAVGAVNILRPRIRYDAGITPFDFVEANNTSSSDIMVSNPYYQTFGAGGQTRYVDNGVIRFQAFENNTFQYPQYFNSTLLGTVASTGLSILSSSTSLPAATFAAASGASASNTLLSLKNGSGTEKAKFTNGGNLELASDNQLQFGGATDAITGNSTSHQIDFYANNTAVQRLKSTGLQINGSTVLSFGSSGVNTPDVGFCRDAAGRIGINDGSGTCSSYRDLKLRNFFLSSALMVSSTAPTVTSAGTSPSITASNGTAAFIVNVGTGGTATDIVLAMPTANAGWICHANNITATAANRADQAVRQTASTTTSVTLQNQTVSTGAALAFTASDLVRCQCTAY